MNTENHMVQDEFWPTRRVSRLRCEKCGENLLRCEEFAYIKERLYCEDCLGKISVPEWLAFLDEEMRCVGDEE
jgi:formylmethanofuran dehydrogenase subunit E